MVGQYRSEREGILFEGQSEHQYYAVEKERWLTPIHVSAVQNTPELVSLVGGLDYIAIGDERVLPEIEPLLELHKSNGLNTGSVPLEAIYDQFNYGITEPEAIRSFLRFISSEAPHPPQYVLARSTAPSSGSSARTLTATPACRT